CAGQSGSIMPIVQSADGVQHQFPDGTDPAVIDRAMKAYAARGSAAPQGQEQAPGIAVRATKAVGDYFASAWNDLLSGAKALPGAIAAFPEEARRQAQDIAGKSFRDLVLDPQTQRTGMSIAMATGGAPSPIGRVGMRMEGVGGTVFPRQPNQPEK